MPQLTDEELDFIRRINPEFIDWAIQKGIEERKKAHEYYQREDVKERQRKHNRDYQRRKRFEEFMEAKSYGDL